MAHRWPDPEKDNHYNGDLSTANDLFNLITLLDTYISSWIVLLVSLCVVGAGMVWVFSAYCIQLRVATFWTVLHGMFKEPIFSHRAVQCRAQQGDERTLPCYSFRVYFHADAEVMRRTFPPSFVELLGEDFIWWYVFGLRVVHLRAWNFIGAIIAVSYYTVISGVVPSGVFLSLFSSFFLLDMTFRFISLLKISCMWAAILVFSALSPTFRRHGIAVHYRKRWQVFWSGLLSESQVSREYLTFNVSHPRSEAPSIPACVCDDAEEEDGSSEKMKGLVGSAPISERTPLIDGEDANSEGTSGVFLEKHHAVILLPAGLHEFPKVLTGYLSPWEFARLALACEARIEAHAPYRNWVEFFEGLNKTLAPRGIELGYGFCHASWWFFDIPILPIPFPFRAWPLLPPKSAVRYIDGRIGAWSEDAIFVRWLSPDFPEQKPFDGIDVVRKRSASARRVLEHRSQPFVVFNLNPARMVALTAIQAARNIRIFRGKWDGEPAHTRFRLMVYLCLHSIMLPLLVVVFATVWNQLGICIILIVLYTTVLMAWATADIVQYWRLYLWFSYFYMVVPFSIIGVHMICMENWTPKTLPLFLFSSMVMVFSWMCAIQLNRHCLNLKYPYPDILGSSFPVLDEDFATLEDVLSGVAQDEPPRIRALSRRGVTGGRICVFGRSEDESVNGSV